MRQASYEALQKIIIIRNLKKYQTQGQSKLGKIISYRKKLAAKAHALEYVLFLLYYS